MTKREGVTGCMPAGDAHIKGVEGAAIEAEEVHKQHAQIHLQVKVPTGARPRRVQQQECCHHHQQCV